MENVLTFPDSIDSEGTNPRPLPEGHYICQIMGGEEGPRQDNIEVKGEDRPVLKINLCVISTGDGETEVETDDGRMNVKNMRIFETFFLEKGSFWKLNQMVKAAGLDSSGNSLDLDELQGKQVEVITKNRPNKLDPDQVFTNVKKYLFGD